MLSNGMTPMFNTGTIPRFASGTKKKLFQAVGETAGKFLIVQKTKTQCYG